MYQTTSVSQDSNGKVFWISRPICGLLNDKKQLGRQVASQIGSYVTNRCCTVAALHQGAPGQMTWLEGWPTWLAPWLKNMSVKTQLLCFSNSVKKYCKCYRISSIHSFYFECNNRRCQLASYIISWRSLVNHALCIYWLIDEMDQARGRYSGF